MECSRVSFRGVQCPGSQKGGCLLIWVAGLWLLFENCLSDILQATADGTAELISFNTPLLQVGGLTLLGVLKDEDRVEDVANDLVESMPGLNVEYRIRLKEFFSLTLQLNPGKRTCDLTRVIGLLSQKK